MLCSLKNQKRQTVDSEIVKYIVKKKQKKNSMYVLVTPINEPNEPISVPIFII